MRLLHWFQKCIKEEEDHIWILIIENRCYSHSFYVRPRTYWTTLVYIVKMKIVYTWRQLKTMDGPQTIFEESSEVKKTQFQKTRLWLDMSKMRQVFVQTNHHHKKAKQNSWRNWKSDVESVNSAKTEPEKKVFDTCEICGKAFDNINIISNVRWKAMKNSKKH